MHTGTFPITGFDLHWEKVVNSWTQISPVLNQVGIVLAKYAPEIWAAIFILLWFWPPLRQNRARRAVVYAAVAGVVALAINVILGHVLPYRPRPFVFEPGQIHQLLAHAPDTSFPSDHASGSFAFAIGLFYARRRDGWWSLLLAAAISLSRVFVGLHWPTDVLAGAVVGTFSGLLVLSARSSLEWLVRGLFRVFRFQPERRYRRYYGR